MFPGQMDAQLALGDDLEGKWAVKKIMVHLRSGEKSSLRQWDELWDERLSILGRSVCVKSHNQLAGLAKD